MTRKPIAPNKIGQVWTPDVTADYMVREAFSMLPSGVRLAADPGCGPATFLKAMIRCNSLPEKIICWDSDRRMCDFTRRVMRHEAVHGFARCSDYLGDLGRFQSEKADLVIMNPPYIRHEMIDKKEKKQYRATLAGMGSGKLDLRSNLYVYFLVGGMCSLREGGVLCAIVYDAIGQTRYGETALSVIRNMGETIKIDKVKTPFKDVMIDASILFVKKTNLGSRKRRRVKAVPKGMINLGELVDVRRGTGLTSRKVFVAKYTDPHYGLSKPFFMKQQRLEGLVVDTAKINQRAYIYESGEQIDSNLTRWLGRRLRKESVVAKDYFHLRVSERILFNYYIRSNPRHLYNRVLLPVSDNFYAIRAKHIPQAAAWLLLNSGRYLMNIEKAGRTQGAGLTKVQLYEYRSALVPDWRAINPRSLRAIDRTARKLQKTEQDIDAVKRKADRVIAKYL